MHALQTLKDAFSDLDRYEDLLAVRAADARHAFGQSLALFTQSAAAASSHRSPEFTLPHLPDPPNHLHANNAGAPSSRMQFSPSAAPLSRHSPHAAAALPPPWSPSSPAGYGSASASASGAPASAAGHSTRVAPAHAISGSNINGIGLGTGVGPFSSLAQNLPPPPSASASTPSKRRRYDWVSASLDNGHAQALEPEWEKRRYSDDGGHSTRIGNGAPLGRLDARQLVRTSKERNRLGLDYASSQIGTGLNNNGSAVGAKARRKRARSGSRSSAGSSIGDLLLETAETATNGGGDPRSVVVDSAVSTNASGLSRNGTGTKVPPSQLVTLGPGGTTISGGQFPSSLIAFLC